jgi:ribosomal protein S18 acetylase RimI-like enzyme
MMIDQNLKIRPLTAADEPFIWEAVYHAIFVPAGESPPPRSILADPNIARYAEAWGRAGDLGFAAELSGRRIGACWLRLWSKKERGYGYVDAETPELSLAVWPGHRGNGIGTRLLKATLVETTSFSGVSLSVSSINPAVHLYDRMGFERVLVQGSNLVMVRRTPGRG